MNVLYILERECEDEILNATGKLIIVEKKACPKKNYFINVTSLPIIYLLLFAVICAGCYFYYTKYQAKQKHVIPFQDVKINLEIKKK